MIKWTSTSHICRLGAEACLFLFINRVNVNYLPVSSFGQENHYCMWQVRALWFCIFFFFFWSRCQQPPSSIRVISICLSWCGLKHLILIKYRKKPFPDKTYEDVDNCLVPVKVAAWNKLSLRGLDHMMLLPWWNTRVTSVHLSSDAISFCLYSLLKTGNSPAPHPPTLPPTFPSTFTFLHSRSIEFQSVISVFMTESWR